MILSLRERQLEETLHADVCIVGAGAAGITLAVQLAAADKRVLLLEAGDRQIQPATQDPYRSEIAGLPHRGIHEGRFRAHGGTTLRWGGQILELNAEDFAERPWVTGSGWPISKSELTPFYRSALSLEGLAGAESEDAAVWSRLSSPQPDFEAMESYLTRWCPEPNFAHMHRAALEGDRIQVWLHANAVALHMEGDVVRGVHCRTPEGKTATFHADAFVFCLGAIESSRFFLQPRAGGLPWNSDGMLGKHFQDHIDVNAARIHVKRPSEFHQAFDNIYLDGYKYHPKIRLQPPVQQAEKLLNVAATMYFVSDVDEKLAIMKSTAKNLLRGHLREIKPSQLAQLVPSLPLLMRQSFRYALQHRAFHPSSTEVWLRVHCEQEPLSHSSITLSEQQDALGLFRTRLDWRIAPREIATIQAFVHHAAEALEGIAQVEAVPSLHADDDSFLSRCDDSNHHMGGMRMALPGHPGVVDPDLLLRGTRNCYVCSSAVFPTSGFSNPTHTLLALAVRLSAALAQ